MSKGNREAATKFILESIDAMAPGNGNVAIYEKRLGGMSDTQFHKFMQDLESGEVILPFISPNLGEDKIDLDRLLKLGDKIGHEFFQRLKLTDPDTGVLYTTNHKYLILDLPVRRQRELLTKKMSIPDNNNVVDDLTNQPTGPSKGSKLSFPELQVLYAIGLKRVPEELLKGRGGDTLAFNKMNRDIIENGEASLEDLASLGGKVKSTETLGIILKGMLLDNNL